MPEVLKYLIVDDEELDRLAIESEAEKFPFLHRIASCSHPLQAAELIRSYPPDILFVDIEMPDISGLNLVKMTMNKSMIPVFITSHPEFAVDSYDIEAFDYLVKPLSSERFARCANRLRDFFQLRDKAFAFDKEQETDYIMIKQGYEKHRLRLGDILYLEAMKDYTRIRLVGKQYLVLSPLINMMEKMPAKKFVRIHRSFVVNVDKITEVSGNKVYIEATELPVGKLYKDALNRKC
ncbi:MAG TPA: LytTR family DNA-binding domain-containing protein [Puia sp.]|nr:LytTR family DNA-binding domain-containing protein [Puia sp.]